MSLPLIGNLIKGKKEKEANYLSLVITPDRVLATIWTFDQNLVKTLGFGHKTFQNQDILVHEAALAIDSAGSQAKVDVTKTVFGLSEFFLDDSSLSRQTAKTLKNLSTELELDPQAFVPISAGVNHLLKVEESQTPHIVLLGIFGDFCEVHLLEGGKAVQSKSTQTPINIEKVKNLVASLKEEGRELPARIVICGLAESHELADKITKYDWHDVFVHDPKIDFLDDTELSRSAAYAQAADVLGYDPVIGDEKEEKEKGQEPAGAAIVPDEKPQKSNDLGFVEGEDILLATKPEEDQKEPKQDEVNLIPVPPPPAPKHQAQQYAVDVPETAFTPAHTNQQHKTGKSLLSKLPIPSLSAIFNFDPTSKSGKKILIAVGVVIFLLLGSSFVFGQTLTKAEVVVKVNGQDFEKNFSARVIAGGTYNKDQAEIGGTIVSGRASGNQKAVTTGQKKLGDPAKGQVTVYNWTNAQKSFSQGTGIISKSGVKFKLDGEVSVASRSASAPGQSSVNVVAAEVGPNGNLDAGQDFNFQEFDTLSYSAINQAALTGGAERQTTVVTQEDLDKLEKSLTDSVTEKAKDDLKVQSNGQEVDDGALVVKVLKKQFDKKLDDEAALVNLDMEIEVNALVFQKEELSRLLSEYFAQETAQNMTISSDKSTIEGIVAKRKGDQLDLTGNFKAKIVPKIDQDNLKSQIAGKSAKNARAKIKEMGEVIDVQINFSPNIPLVSSIPRDKDKITFKIETN